MYKQHQISRMFMCRCCNWAFPDKTSLHMHMQAKEEGKNISVPVIGKGNPPPQIVPGAHTNQLLSSTISQQATTLHAPQPRPAANTSQTQFASLPLNSFNSLPAQQQLTITDPNVLQAAAVSLFPHLALLRGDTSTNTQNEDFMAKLQHRLMLNNLVAQSGFGLAAWLASLPKNDQSDCSAMNTDIEMRAESERNTETEGHEENINVDREADDEVPSDVKRGSDGLNENDVNISDDVDEGGCLKHLSPSHDHTDKERSHKDHSSHSHSSAGSISSERSPSLCENMPNLRSAIGASSIDSLNKKATNENSHRACLNDTLLNIDADHRTVSSSEQSSDGRDSHISPSETNSSISPSNHSVRECYACSVLKGKLAVAENRCRYLEERTASLQSDALRFTTRVSVSENSARQYEQETHVLREQNELLQRKLLDCQEKTLSFMQGDQMGNPQAVSIYLNDILKSTFLC
ncbi:hypothetical protein AB6A40_000198 [Gnathostoma spinigerum]|uniref:C2H2-type domain-containing protein n=1 Tax=Gnathostoma spinigerum TaxID=75299 RepID=A0ABD6E7Z0_9BILA